MRLIYFLSVIVCLCFLSSTAYYVVVFIKISKSLYVANKPVETVLQCYVATSISLVEHG